MALSSKRSRITAYENVRWSLCVASEDDMDNGPILAASTLFASAGASRTAIARSMIGDVFTGGRFSKQVYISADGCDFDDSSDTLQSSFVCCDEDFRPDRLNIFENLLFMFMPFPFRGVALWLGNFFFCSDELNF